MTNTTAAPVDRSKEWAAAKDAITQVLTLASGVLALSLTFSKNWAESASATDKRYLFWSWAFMFVSIVFGLISLLLLAGIAYTVSGRISHGGLRAVWIVEIIALLVGLVLLVKFGWGVLHPKPS